MSCGPINLQKTILLPYLQVKGRIVCLNLCTFVNLTMYVSTCLWAKGIYISINVIIIRVTHLWRKMFSYAICDKWELDKKFIQEPGWGTTWRIVFHFTAMAFWNSKFLGLGTRSFKGIISSKDCGWLFIETCNFPESCYVTNYIE